MAQRALYYMLGQEPALRGDLQEEWLTENLDQSIDDAETLIKVWDYDATAVASYDTTPGSMTSNTQTAGDKTIVSYDATAFRKLLADLHSTGFHCVKRTAMGSVGGASSNRWGKAHAESYPTFATADTNLRTNITGGGDTPDPKGFFLSFGYNEAIEGLTAVDDAFEADLLQLILDLRTDYASATTPVVLDLPPKTVSGLSANQQTSLANARRVIRKVARESTNVSYVKTDDLVRRTAGATIAERFEYAGEATMTLGRRIGAEMVRMVRGKASAPHNGVPVVIVIGEGDIVGQVDNDFVEANTDYDVPFSSSYIWNWSNQQWEPYDASANANTEADGLANIGVETTLVAELDQLLEGGAWIFKLGRNDSSIGDAAAAGGSWNPADDDLFELLVDEWAIAKLSLIETFGQVPDVIGIVIAGGEGDVSTDQLASDYLTNLESLIDNLRGEVSTRADGSKTPVILAQMKDTGNFDPDRVALVRQTQFDWAATDGAAALVDLDAFEVGSDNIHLSGEGLFKAGYQIAGAIQTTALAV